MAFQKISDDYTNRQFSILVLLRVVIGWHFLYEGVSKLLTPAWSAAAYLDQSRWILKDLFNWMAGNSLVLSVVDFLNIWGLIFIGLVLILGLFIRWATISGIFLLLLYYIAYPPFIGLDIGVPLEGHYLFVDKNLVELIALCVLTIFPSGHIIGLDRFIIMYKNKKQSLAAGNPKTNEQDDESKESRAIDFNRREIIKGLATLPVLGAFVFAVLKKIGWESYEEKHLEESVDSLTGATVKAFNYSRLKDLKGKIPHGRISGLNLSKVILGGNLVGGWAHARDLIYVSKLVKSYHTKEKIFETFFLAEKCGINCFLTNPVLSRVIDEYL